MPSASPFPSTRTPPRRTTSHAKNSCTPGLDFHTPSPARLAVVVDAAHAAGLKVFLRPYLDQSVLQKQYFANWRGNIKPASPGQWFANYRLAMTPYLRMAQQHKVEHFAISTELQSMATFTSNWNAAIKFARTIYKGNLVFTFSWLKNKSEVRLTGTTPGMDTYPGIPSLANTATVAQVLAGWNKLLATTDRLAWISSVADDEVGIPAQDNAYKYPNAQVFPISQNPFNQTIRATWFSAACRFAKQHKMKAIYFWGSTLTERGGALLSAPAPDLTGEIQPLSQTAIKSCFGH